MSEDAWTVENEMVYAPLHRKKRRFEEKARRDKKRVRKFTPRKRTVT